MWNHAVYKLLYLFFMYWFNVYTVDIIIFYQVYSIILSIINDKMLNFDFYENILLITTYKN